jgi:hypothetical protein
MKIKADQKEKPAKSLLGAYYKAAKPALKYKFRAE